MIRCVALNVNSMLYASFLFFTHGYILSVKEKLPEIEIRYFGNHLTYLDVLIYFHDSGQRPNGCLAKISFASLGTVMHVQFLTFVFV